jgi:hypothetical protein
MRAVLRRVPRIYRPWEKARRGPRLFGERNESAFSNPEMSLKSIFDSNAE